MGVEPVNRSYERIESARKEAGSIAANHRCPSFDVLAEGLVSEKSRENKTAIELFLACLARWDCQLLSILRQACQISGAIPQPCGESRTVVN
jgi:hypothetical protein